MANTNPEFSIYKDLRKKILTGELENGDRLVETALAAKYDTSRLHIKSALRLLAQENLAEHIAMCGFIVKGFSEESMEEVIELRIALERVIFKRFVEVASDEDIAHLRKTTQKVAVFLENDMVEDAMEEVDHFYSYTYEHSGYPRIMSILETYSDYLKIIRRQSASETQRNQDSLQLLFDIMDAIEKRDVETLMKHLERRRLSAE